MKRFKQYLIEKADYPRRVNPFHSAINLGKEIGSAFASNPSEFTKQYATSLATDPETYHSALAGAGMVPGVGEVADIADAGLYAAQGDTEGTKLALASTIPFAGMLPGLARLKKAEQSVRSAVKDWKQSPSWSEYQATMGDPFFGRKVQEPMVATERAMEDLRDNAGALIPEVGNPTATLSARDILTGVYGKDAQRNIEMARRSQRKNAGKLKPENPSEFLVPDYSDEALDRPFSVYVGTHTPEDLNSEISGLGHAGAQYTFALPSSVTINADRYYGQAPFMTKPSSSFPETMAHEVTHALGYENPQSGMGQIARELNYNPGDFAATWAAKTAKTGGPIVDRYPQIMRDFEANQQVRDTAAEMGLQIAGPGAVNKLPEHPNNALVFRYFTNTELPGQIAQAKAWMRSKGLPDVNANMSQGEATQLRDMILDKFGKGRFPEFAPHRGGRTVPAAINIIGHPEGKMLFDIIAKKTPGQRVNDKTRDMGYA